jgi:anti-sigma factor RsiW
MAITCNQCQTHLLAYHHNELPPRRARAVSAHLQDCDACYAAYVGTRDADRQFTHDLHTPQPSDAQLDAIWGGIQAELAAPSRPPRRAFPSGAAVATLAVMFALLWTMQTSSFTTAAMPFGLTPAVEPETPALNRDTTRTVALVVATENAIFVTPTHTPAVTPEPPTAG